MVFIKQTMYQEDAKMDIEEQENWDKSAQEEEVDEVFTDGARNGPASYQNTARQMNK